MRHLAPRLLAPTLLLALAACRDGTPSSPGPASLALGRNPTPAELGPLPAATVPRLRQPERPSLSMHDAAALSPASFSATLLPGQTVTEHKIATLPAAPPKGDVLFMMDLTGSMGGELNNLKVNATNIMTAVAGVIPDAQFGVASHMDYPGVFVSALAAGQACDYVAAYGQVGVDVPWKLDQSITGSNATVQTALNGLSLGSGIDLPESFSRALYETYSDASVGWRAGAMRVVVAFGDDLPHDCGLGTGNDPGRDGIIGTADDLEIEDVIAGMVANNVILINLTSSTVPFIQAQWNGWAAATGGTNFVINADGTFPGGVDPATAIADLIQAQVANIAALSFVPCAGFGAFAPWVEGVTGLPAGTTLPANLAFDVEVGPPAGTAPGTYVFDLCLIGDGAELGRQTVTIRVPASVLIDIKPGSFPNSINLFTGNDGKLPVAILGSASFDVSDVDLASVRIGNEVPSETPINLKNNGSFHAAYEDVNGDGFTDLVMHFSRDAIKAAGDLTSATTELVVTGQTTGGLLFRGTDSVRPVPPS